MPVSDTRKTGALSYAFSPGVAKKSLAIAVIVGTLLSAANQGDMLLRESFTTTIAIKLLLNFLTPFTVSSVSAVLNRPGK